MGIQAGELTAEPLSFQLRTPLPFIPALCSVTALNPLLRYSVPESDQFSLILRCPIASEGKLSETMGLWNAGSFFMKTVWRALSERNEPLDTSVFLGTRALPPPRSH